MIFESKRRLIRSINGNILIRSQQDIIPEYDEFLIGYYPSKLMESNKRENPEQIPKEDDSRGKTGKIISEQAGVEGQRKEVNVESYSKVAAIGQILKNMDFPADKSKIIEYVQQHHSSDVKNKDEILSALEKLEEKQYKNVSDITTAAGLVY